jgi:hypothetical protein
MKKTLFIIICVCLFSCEKENRVIPDGNYSGSFKYGTDQMWASFGITGESFEEYASGGVISQKFPTYCLTKGTYKIHNGTIVFNNIQIAQPPNKELNTCDEDYLLKGTYNIEELTDSTISFWKEANLGKQEYRLKRFYSE